MNTKDYNKIAHKTRLARRELETSQPNVVWFVKYLETVINEKNDELKKYKDFFETMNNFLPKEVGRRK